MSKTNGKRKRTIGDVLRMIIIIIALGVFCYSAYQLITIYLEYKKGVDEYNSLNSEYVKDVGDEILVEDLNGEQVMENPIDFTRLKKENSDIIGWISVGAIDISYPVMYYTDNDFYLHRTFEKVYNFAGCLFVDYLNKKDFSDKNTIVYGHNMKNGSMFGKLKDFKDPAVYESDPYFWIYTPDYIYEYQIFACQEVSMNGETYQLTFASDKDFKKYTENCIKNSYIDTKVSVEKDDRIVTLSTCTVNDTSRFVVQGKLLNTYKSK